MEKKLIKLEDSNYEIQVIFTMKKKKTQKRKLLKF